ncbi:MAG: tyrosine-type recombinase/integrase [Actinomycetota bacterium]
MLLATYVFHLRARNLSPATIKATQEYLRPFLAVHDPMDATKTDCEAYLGEMASRCQPATVMTAWRHLTGLFRWLHEEGDIETNPMAGIPRPVVPQVEIPMATREQVLALLKSCEGRDPLARRDYALIAIMLDTGLRLSEVVGLTLDDISDDFTLRVFGKGRKWRTVALGFHVPPICCATASLTTGYAPAGPKSTSAASPAGQLPAWPTATRATAQMNAPSPLRRRSHPSIH